MSTFPTTASSPVIGDPGLDHLPRGIVMNGGAHAKPNGKAWHTPVVIEVTGAEADEIRRAFEIEEAQQAQARAGLGHNSGAVDPGLATDFEDNGPLAIRRNSVPAEELEAFYEAIRSQGNADVRQRAMTNAVARARADPAIKHHDYRLLEQIASCSRWQYRYCCQSNKALAYFAAQSDAKNIGRSLSNLLGAEAIAGVDVPRQIGGWPVTYYTLRCTAEDRSNQTIGNLNEAFKRVVSSRQADDLLPSSTPPNAFNPGQGVPQTTCKSSPRGVASRPPDAQSVNRQSVKEDSLGANAPVDATLFADAAPSEGAPPPSKSLPCRPSDGTPTKRKPPAPKATEEQFARFWAVYPIKEGKAAARKNFMALSHDDAELAVIGAKKYAEKIAAERTRLAKRGEEPRIKWAQGWLTDRRFEDYEPGGQRPASRTIDDDLKELAASQTGRDILAEDGSERGMERLRKIATDNRRRNGIA